METYGHITKDLVLAVCITMFGATVAWFLTGGLPAIGIDDAAITRSYAENIANGAGYVYNVGGERVEGSTALLWVMLLTVLYWITPTPEVAILLLCGVFATVTTFVIFRMARHIAIALDLSASVVVTATAVMMLASFGYFMWSVWTMMELALWSMLLTSQVWLLSLLIDPADPYTKAGRRVVVLLVLISALLPMVRPEGIAMSLGLCMAALIVSRQNWRVLIGSMAASVAVFVAITAFRLSYFGQPFPNTFYAKVSSDRLQGMVEGAKYLLSFILGAPFAELLVVAWIGLTVWGVFKAFGDTRGARTLALSGACVFAMLLIYAVLGGDHFVLWRFYQPVQPLLNLGLAVLVGLGIARFSQSAGMTMTGLVKLSVIAAAGAVVLVSAMQYYQSRFMIVREYTLVTRGTGFGDYLNKVEPKPTIGTGPAGGIALAYDGEILDLLGLNWTEMAHANPVKIGMRNHASFDLGVFWKHKPEVFSVFGRQCTTDGRLSFWSTDDMAFDGLFTDPTFQAEYVPVTFNQDTNCWPAFAQQSWLDVAKADGMRVFSWSDVEFKSN